MPALAIRQDRSAGELRRLARHEPDRRAAMRLLAIANALDGLSRADAARLVGMERQALRDAVTVTTPMAWKACTTVAARVGRKGCRLVSRRRSRPLRRLLPAVLAGTDRSSPDDRWCCAARRRSGTR
jgi:hypothetical protein